MDKKQVKPLSSQEQAKYYLDATGNARVEKMDQSYSHSFWEKGAFLKSYDLIIIGAGITGLSAALFAKRQSPDRSVLVLERGTLPMGASTKNAGFACIGSITEHQADLERTSLAEVKKHIQRRYEGLQLLKSTLGEEALNYEQCGGYELFTSDEAFSGAADHISKFNKWLSELFGQEEVYTPQKLNGYQVIHNRLEGALHPGKMIRNLIQLVEEAGVEIRWNTPVRQVHRSGTIVLEDGTQFSPDHILVATNGFTSRLLPGVAITPNRGFILITSPIEDLKWQGTFHHNRGYIYFRNHGKRLLLGGARNIAESEEQTDQFGTNPKVKRHLVQFANEVLKLPPGWEIEQEWSGIMGFTDSKTPVIKQVDERVYVAAGLSGMGIAIGMQVGQKAAEMLE